MGPGKGFDRISKASCIVDEENCLWLALDEMPGMLGLDPDLFGIDLRSLARVELTPVVTVAQNLTSLFGLDV